jgi:hypothetical protein
VSPSPWSKPIWKLKAALKLPVMSDAALFAACPYDQAALALEFGPNAGEREQRSAVIEGEPNHVLFLGLRVRLGAYSAKLFTGTRQRLSGFSQPRECGDEVFRYG